jgi:heme/copper-type cytochrome/quinol oxidase subunit 2
VSVLPGIRKALNVIAVSALLIGLIGCSNSANNPAPGNLTINVTIANRQVDPVNATLQAKVRQPITVHVTSDAADELHVHSVPDHKFEIAAAPNQTFQFTVDVPGSVEVELHHLDRTIATIQVRP